MLISIIVPVFNSSLYLRETIDCIINQSYSHFEAIFIDNCSTDDSVKIIESYSDSRIILAYEKRKGACFARNLGFSLSRGEIIQYLDSDDLLTKDYLERKVHAFRSNGLKKVVFSRLASFDSDISSFRYLSKKLEKNYSSGLLMLIDMARFQQPSQISAWTISRDLQIKSGDWDNSLLRNQDGEMLMRLLINSDGTIFLSDINSFYRNSSNSISKNFSIKALQSLYLSFNSYQLHMLGVNKSKAVVRAVQQFYLSLVIIPEATNLREIVFHHVFGLKCKPIMGGVFPIRIFSYVFGVRITSSFIIFLKKIISNRL